MTTKFEKLLTFRKPWSYKNWMLIADVFSIKIPYLQGTCTSAEPEPPDDVLQLKLQKKVLANTVEFSIRLAIIP